jgi:hypothetical protein
MLYVEEFATQRMNENTADREANWRTISEHWHLDRRTQPASRWAIVRLWRRIVGRSRAASPATADAITVSADPSPALPTATHDEPAATGGIDAVTDASAARNATGSAAAGSSDAAAKDLVTTR